jgi:putative transposase
MVRIDDLHFYNERGKTDVWQNRLPHWQQDEAVYFVTFHLGDSLPEPLLRRWEAERETWRRSHPEPWSDADEQEYHSRFSSEKEKWLDEGHGACVLRSPRCREIVAAALMHFEGDRCNQISWVVMPNHVHALFVLRSGQHLADLLQSWKSFTGLRINGVLVRDGKLWQKDYFDRLIRDGQHLDNCIRYIRRRQSCAKMSSPCSRVPSHDR